MKHPQEPVEQHLKISVACRRSDLKELKMRPSTDEHDYQVRLRSAIKFLTKVCPGHIETHDTCATTQQCSIQANKTTRWLAGASSGTGGQKHPGVTVCCTWCNVRCGIPAWLQGDKVKLTCQFRGREREFQDIARDMFDVSTWSQALAAAGMVVQRLQ
jgi:hypothetical protein